MGSGYFTAGTLKGRPSFKLAVAFGMILAVAVAGGLMMVHVSVRLGLLYRVTAAAGCLVIGLWVLKGEKLLTCPHPLAAAGTWGIVFLVVFLGVYMLYLLAVPLQAAAVMRLPREMRENVLMAAGEAGLLEETAMRMLALAAFVQWTEKRRHTLVLGALATSLLFGLIHLGNLNGTNTLQVWIQVFYATMLGLALCCLRMLTNTISLPILAHFLIDLQPTLLSGSEASGPLWIYVAVFLPLGVISWMTIAALEKGLAGSSFGKDSEKFSG
jgi:membrane protease YdiL (CAAX protease family)